MTILLTVYGVAIIVLSVLMVGIVQRMMMLQNRAPVPLDADGELPEWLLSRIDAEHPYHLVIVVDDSCGICHRTIQRINEEALSLPGIASQVSVLAGSESFVTQGPISVIVDAGDHRVQHPGWAPAGLIYSASGLIERVPVGSEEAIEHTLERLATLTKIQRG